MILQDPEWQPYHALYGSRQAVHPEAGPCFICEGRYLVEEALAAGRAGDLRILSVATVPRQEAAYRPLLPPGAKLLVAPEAELEALLGFAFHRGVLCCAARPEPPSREAILAAGRLLVLPRLDNVDNLGQLLRTAVALGMEAVLAGHGPSPFDRRSVRVSMGAAWRIPVLQELDLGPWLEAWRTWAPGEAVAAALTPAAQAIGTWRPTARTALVLGPEDKGLDAAWLDRCDRHVVIPMAHGMDSLNVAAAGAILMHWMAGNRREAARE